MAIVALDSRVPTSVKYGAAPLAPAACDRPFSTPRGIAYVTLLNWIDFDSLGDERGGLVALEIGHDKKIPFEVRRIYYIHRTEQGVSRGFHAHRNLKQVAICVSGRCRVVLDDGERREETWLDSPLKGLVIGNLTWRELHDFSPDCVVLVLASEHYDESDYIRDYEEFLKQSRNG